MSDHDQDGFDNVEIVEQSSAAAIRGRDVQDFISMRDAIPNVDWIMKNVVSQGAGTRAEVARIIGKVKKTSRQTNKFDGKELESVKLHGGQFEMTVFNTGEIKTGIDCYLPKAFSRQVEQALAGAMPDDGTVVLMDISLGVEATGKPIPYRWTVKTFMSLPDDAELDQLRSRRPALPSKDAGVPQLAHGSEAGQDRLALEHSA